MINHPFHNSYFFTRNCFQAIIESLLTRSSSDNLLESVLWKRKYFSTINSKKWDNRPLQLNTSETKRVTLARSCKNIMDCALCHNSFESFLFDSGTELYGNMGCRLSKRGILNQIDFWLTVKSLIPIDPLLFPCNAFFENDIKIGA